jgi:TRAP-type C4-dicarboxylate transport system substrate-binding protein
MKKITVFSIIIIGVILFMGVYTQSASASEVVEPIVLKYASTMPPISPLSKTNIKWVERIEQQSGGRLKIKPYFAESLAKQVNTFRAVQDGITDIAFYILGWNTGLLPLNEVTRLPFMGIPSQKAATSIQWALYNKFPELQKEFSGLKVIQITGTPPDQFHFTKKEVRVPADVKGMKLLGGGRWPEMMKNLGAVVLDQGVGDWYMSLERGLAEGHITHFVVIKSVRTLELFKYHVLFGDPGCSIMIMPYLMNPDSWKKLTPDLQKILEDACKWQEEEILKPDEVDIQAALKFAQDNNHKLSNLTAEEIQQWVDAAKPVHEKWIAENSAKGPARAIYDEAKRLISEYTKRQMH